MNIENLKKEKTQLEQQREQAIATINQITGAIAILDKLIIDMEKQEIDQDNLSLQMEPKEELKKTK